LAITECSDNIIYEKAVLVDQGLHTSSGMWQESYDTNDDGRLDIMALSDITGIVVQGTPGGGVTYHHDKNPKYWLVDRDQDGSEPDEIYQDINGDGECHDIKFISPWPLPRDFDLKREGNT